MAKLLSARLSYTNTFVHQAPYLDITKPDDYTGSAEFLTSSEVFEHVPPPVQRAFDGAYAILKPGGHLILSVPYFLQEETVEHFPDLNEYTIATLGSDRILVNRARDGTLTARSGLVFHGGAGDTLEMRIFSESAVLSHLTKAGFCGIQVLRTDVPEWGILHKQSWGLPIVAKRPS
jgi:hypothetical protein